MSGRPDNGSADLPELRQQVGADGVLASVVSSVNLTTGRGTISYVYPVSGLPVTGISQDSPAVLRAVDGNGAVLGEFPVQVKPYADLPGDERRGLIDVVLPVPAGTTSLALVIDGLVADTHSVGGTPPAVRAIRPAVTPDGQLRVEMEFDRELTGRLNYAVQVSADDGRTWLTAGVGLKDTTFTLDRSQFAAARLIRVRVITSAGTSASVVTSEPFRVGDRDADR